MFTGSINIVDDLALASNCACQGCKVIYIGELNNNLPPQFISCPILLPPYEVLCAEVEGDFARYRYGYNQYLDNNKECYDTIMTILTSMTYGDNIIIYIENGNQMSHQNFLIEYFTTKFGVMIGNKERVFSINPNYVPILKALVYEFVGNKYISANDVLMGIMPEVLLNIPVSFQFAGFIFQKLFDEIGCQTMDELMKYHSLLNQFVTGNISRTNDVSYDLVVKEEK